MSLRRFLPVFLAATAVLPAVALGAVLVAVPGAGAVPAAHAAVAASATPNPTTSTISTTPFPPGPPTNLAASAVSANSVTLTWTASRPGCCSIAGYNIGYIQAFNDVAFPLSVGNVTTVTIGNLSRATEYRFWVSARDDQGRLSTSSNTLTVVTPATDTGPDTTPPTAPTGLTVGDVTPNSAMLSWSPSTDNIGVTGYQIYRFDGLFISTLLTTVTETSFRVPLTLGRNIYYVRARDAVGNVSIAAGPVTIDGSVTPSTPPAPTCRITYTTQAQWSGGFVAVVTVANTGPSTVNGWTLGFSFPSGQQITNGWNAVISQTGPAVTARNVAYNSTLAPGASASFGFQGTHTGTSQPPTAFTLNGAPCSA